MEEITLEKILSDLDTSPSLANPKYVEDLKGAIVDYSKIPSPYIYTLDRVIELANAYKELEMQKPGTEAYKKNAQIVENFKNTLKKIEDELRLYRKLGQEDKIEELKKVQQLMYSFHDKATTLSSYLIKIEQSYLESLVQEKTRYKKKLSKLENDKNNAINTIKEEKGIAKRLTDTFIKVGPAIATGIAAYNIPGDSYIKAIIAIITAVITYLPLDYIVNRIEDKRINKIISEFEPLFKDADVEHEEKKKALKESYDKVIKELCEIAVIDMVLETQRYFKEAVILPKKE